MELGLRENRGEGKGTGLGVGTKEGTNGKMERRRVRRGKGDGRREGQGVVRYYLHGEVRWGGPRRGGEGREYFGL